MVRWLLSVLLAIHVPGALAARLTPGSLQGALQVAPDGAATYTVPIKVPPGVGAIEPRLSLTYNSRGGPGAFGAGWALTGYSVIQRGPRNLRDDGIVRGVQLGPDDALFLDGEKLVLVARTAALAEFRTRVDTYSRIRAQLDASGQPVTFTVETKAGAVMRFGGGSASRSTLPQGVTTTWMMDETVDRSGNYMTLRYLQDGLDYHLTEVLYGGNRRRGSPPTGRVSIDYEHTDVYASRYVVGVRVDQRMRAKQLTVSGLLPEGPKIFRRYEIKQGNRGSADKRKVAQLQTIVEHAPGGKEALFFRPTEFSYSQAEPKWQPSDLLESIPDLPDGPATAGHFRLLRLGAPTDGIVAPAVAIHSTVGDKEVSATLRLNISSGRWTLASEFKLPVKLGGGAVLDSSVAVVDVDGDGRDDIVASGSATNGAATYLSTDGGWSSAASGPPFAVVRSGIEQSGVLPIDVLLAGNVKRRVFLWQSPQGPRASFFEAGAWRDMPQLQAPLPGSSNPASRNQFAIDVDCDGRKELVIVHNGATRVFRHDLQHGWLEDVDTRFKVPSDVLRQHQGSRMVDLNGDGCADVLASVRSGGVLRQTALLASPSGWAPDPRQLPPIALWDSGQRTAQGEVVTAPGGVVSVSANGSTTDGAYRLETGGWVRDDLYALPDRLPSRYGERQLSFGVVPTDKDKTTQLVYLPASGDGSRLPRLAFFNRFRGWEFDRQYAVPVDISVFDKIDLGVRFIDVKAMLIKPLFLTGRPSGR